MTTRITGHSWGPAKRDRDGYREYKLTTEITADVTDGPAAVMQTAGLAGAGDVWQVGTDTDEWAYCKLDMELRPKAVQEPCILWTVDQTFSTKSDEQRCKDKQIDDPLLRPAEIDGDFTSYQEEATEDRFGKPLTTSSHEMLRGAQVEFDKNRMTVKIEMNVPSLRLNLLCAFADCVNDRPLWGFAARCIKLSKPKWKRKFYGQCFVYYTWTLNFEIRGDTFDRNALDEGTKALNGHWNLDTTEWVLDDIFGGPPDPKDPRHFIRFQDVNGNYTKCVLNGAGVPCGPIASGVTNSFVCIADSALNVPLTDGDAWVQLTDLATDLFDVGRVYERGDTVYDAQGDAFIALSAVAANNLAGGPPGGAWKNLPEGTDPEGVYDKTVTYGLGSLVTDPEGVAPGYISIQKYNEANFLLLGIPTDLGTDL